MNDWLSILVQKYHRRGLLVDTNILLLHCVGSFNPASVATFRRTGDRFAVEDFTRLSRFWRMFQKIYSTPAIIAETSNLLGQFAEPNRSQVRRMLAGAVQAMTEHYTASKQLTLEPTFVRLGLTDSSIEDVTGRDVLVLTDDLVLVNLLTRAGRDAINFNHIRSFGARR